MGYSVFQNAVVIQLSTSLFQQAVCVTLPLCQAGLPDQFSAFVFLLLCVRMCVCVCVSRILIICIFQFGL